jgi:Protein of Unknown function (DUF2784)
MYGLLADLTVAAHFGFVAFVPVGGFLALRNPRVLLAHVPAVGWAAGIVAIGWTCPLTSLERDFRERAGRTAHEDGFIATYLSGVVYPEQYLVLAQGLVAASIVTSYALLLRRHVSGQHSLAGASARYWTGS